MTTGIDWSQPASFLTADPYLAWADTTKYQHFRLPSANIGWWMVVIELNLPSDGCAPIDALFNAAAPDWLQVAPIYARDDIKKKKFRFCSARVGQTFFSEVVSGSLKEVVARYRLCLPVEYPVEALKSHATQIPSPLIPMQEGHEGQTIMALIDGGLALGNSAFLNGAGKSRIRHFWRQDDYSGSRYLNDAKRTRQALPFTDPWQDSVMGYGAELTRQALDDTLGKHSGRGTLDESALYQDLGFWELDRVVHHGTHVFSLAAGPYLYPHQFCDEDQSVDWQTRDQASSCDLMAVQLAWANVLDTSGRSSDANILDALMYLCARCPEKARLIVNISWGCYAGPHDGSSILEQAMLAWCGLRDADRLRIVLSAGNNYQSRGHANKEVPAGEAFELQWRVPPESHTPHFLELWFETDKMDSVQISLESPVSSRTPPGKTTIAVNKVAPMATLAGVATLVLVNRSYLGSGTMALLALNPTAGASFDQLAAAGRWKVRVKNKGAGPLKVDAFIERNDVALGLSTGARQSYFEDEKYNEHDAVDDPPVALSPIHTTRNGSDIRRTGSFSSFSTGSDRPRVFSVGASVHFPVQKEGHELPAPYSPRPRDMSNRPRRDGVKRSSDCLAPGDERVALWGLRGAGSRSGSVVRLSGTSVSVAQVVRKLANGVDPFPPLRPDEI